MAALTYTPPTEEYMMNLYGLLGQVTSPDTQAIAQATATLTKLFWQQPTCIPALLQILLSPSNQVEQPSGSAVDANATAIRQLAAVELRKRILMDGSNIVVGSANSKLWTALPKAVQDQFKADILAYIPSERSTLVRNSAAKILSVLATPTSEFPQLLPFVIDLLNRPPQQTQERELGMIILYSILPELFEEDPSRPAQILPMLQQTIADESSLFMRIYSVRCLDQIAERLESGDEDKSMLQALQALVPTIMAILQQAIEAGKEDACTQLFDVISNLTLYEVPIISKYIRELCTFLCTVAENTNLDDSIRIMTLNCLLMTIRFRRSKMQSLNLAGQMIDCLLLLGCEAEAEDEDDETVSRLAYRCLDTIATSLPPTQVFPHLHSKVIEYLASPDPNKRKSAMMAFAVTVEGCAEFIRPHISKLLPMLHATLADPDPMVRRAACMALNCVCCDLGDECAEQHQTLLPLIFNNLNDEFTQKSALEALEALLECLSDKILPFLNDLVPQMLKMIDAVDVPKKATVVGVLSSAAHAAKLAYIPFFAPTMSKVQPYLSLTEEGEQFELRGATLDCIGVLAQAVGRDQFQPYFDGCMAAAADNIQKKLSSLVDKSFYFFAVMSKVYEKDFAPFLSEIVPHLITSLKQDDFPPMDDKDGADWTDLNEEVDDKTFQFTNAVAQEKEVAVQALAEFMANTTAQFLPYVKDTMEPLIEMLDDLSEDVRSGAVSALFMYLSTLYEIRETQEWQAGLPPKVPLSEDVTAMQQAVMVHILQLWDSETEISVVEQICVELGATLHKCGPAMIDGAYHQRISEHIMEILENRSACQLDADQEDWFEDQNNDTAESAQLLFSAATDVVGALAAVLGNDAIPYMQKMVPAIVKYAAADRATTERSTAVGCLGEIIAGFKADITPFTADLFPIITRAINDQEAEVRSNAAFALGLLIQHTSTDMSSSYIQILSLLQPMLLIPQNAPEPECNARDNTAGAVGRLIMKNADALPLADILPSFFNVLPLKNDFLENKAVYGAIFHLFRVNDQVLKPYLPRMQELFAYQMSPEHANELDTDTTTQLHGLVRHLSS